MTVLAAACAAIALSALTVHAATETVGGTGGDSVVTVIKGQFFPKRTMPTKSGYKFGGYYVSASSKMGQCYNADGAVYVVGPVNLLLCIGRGGIFDIIHGNKG